MIRTHIGRRGASHVVSALILIAIAVAAAIVLYVFSIEQIRSRQGGGEGQTKEQVTLAAYSWTLNLNILTLKLKNVGTTPVTFSEFFINGVKQSTPQGDCPVNNGQLAPQATCTAVITISGIAITAGTSYDVKIISTVGGIFSYSCIAGQSS